MNTPTTRASLVATAAFNTRWFASIVAGSAVLGSAALAVDNNWTGAIDTDWNNGDNWSDPHGFGSNHVPTKGGAHPDDEDAVISVTTGFPVVTANTGGPPRDIKVGFGAGDGRLDVKAGIAASGGGNWFMVGANGNAGTLNVADVDATGGTLTGFGTGTGGVSTPGGRLWIGGWPFGAGGSATMNVNTTGTIAIGNDLAIGTRGTGVMNVDAGTITTSGWNFIGKNDGGAGGNGTLKMSGGTLTNTGRTFVGQSGCTGAIELSGGDYLNVNNEVFMFGENGGTGSATINNSASLLQSNGELWVGEGGGSTGSINLSAGAITIGNWAAIGRNGGSGTVTMTGGSITKTGGSQFIVGASGPGTMTQSAGLVDVQSPGFTWVGEAGGATTASLTISGSAEFRSPIIAVGPESPNATLNLNGGTVRTHRFSGTREMDMFQQTGTGVINFNGSQIIATDNDASFIASVDTATVAAGGLLVDSNGFNLTASQVLGGTGGVVKTGAGTLKLTGANTYPGAHTVTAGKLLTNTSATGVGDFTVADNAGMGVVQVVQDQQVSIANIAMGSAGNTSLDIDLGNFAGITTQAPLAVTNINLAGTVTINIADAAPALGLVPLIAYTSQTGAGSYVLGTLPLGVQATLDTTTPGLVQLNVTNASLPTWNATFSDLWSTDTTPTQENWINTIGPASAFYTEGDPVLFDDSVTGGTAGAVVLNSTVNPSSVTFNNSTVPYSLTGTGAINGTIGLVKQGTESLTLSTPNTYTGVTTLENGTTIVTSLANGGSPSPIGSSSASAANLVFAGPAALEYTGAATTIDRGFTIAAPDNSVVATLNLAADLTTSGQINASLGKLLKTGAGVLTLSGTGANVLGTGSDGDGPPQSLRLAEGGLVFSGAGQTNSVIGRTAFGTAAGVTTVSLLNGATFTGNGRTLVGLTAGADTTLTVSGTSSMQLNDAFQISLSATSVGNVVIENSGSITKTGGWLSIGNDGVGTMIVRDSGTLTSNGDFNVGDVGVSSGFLTIEDSATVTSSGTTFVGKNGNGVPATSTSGTITQTGGTFTSNGWFVIGRFNGSVGTVNLSGGTINQTIGGQALRVGEEGNGTLTVSGTGVVTSASPMTITNGTFSTGIVNLNTGGSITVPRIYEDNGNGGGGNSTFNFDGGTLIAGAGASADFLNGLDLALVLPGGAKIDTNGNTINIGQTLSDGGGGLVKSGAGTLRLNAGNTYSGTTTVTAGTLGGTGSVDGPLVVNAGASIAPGASVGTFTAGATTIAGTYDCELDGINADKLNALGTLDVSAATLNVTDPNPANAPYYIIATYIGAAPAPFASEGVLPAGYTVDYAFNDGVTSTNVALKRAFTAYEAWAIGFGLNPVGAGAPDVDNDGDGQSNAVEFALGGSPLSGSDNARVFHLVGDSQAPVGDELLLTIAVRSGAPAFAGSPAPAATHDGYTYTIEGGDDLSFGDNVTPVSPAVAPPAPNATPPTGYEYRTFSLDNSNGLPSKGFLRVRID